LQLKSWWEEVQFHNHTEITEALQRLLRTAMFAVRFRRPDLIKFIVEDGWQLCGEGIRAYVMDFSRLGRVGDLGSKDTRFGNCSSE